MHHRTLGTQGLKVSAIGYGTMGLTMAYGPGDETEGIATIRRAHELGVNFFDTAEVYGMGTGSNERLLGQAVKDFRDEIVIATKFGFDLSNPEQGFPRTSARRRSGRWPTTVCATSASIRSTCSTSTVSTLASQLRCPDPGFAQPEAGRGQHCRR